MRFAFVFLVVATLFIVITLPVDNSVIYLKLLFATVVFLLIVAFFQELVFLRSKEARYLDLALLLRKTSELEHILTLFGAEGKGLYEKTQSLFPDDTALLDEILLIATARNNAMHGDGKVKDIDELLQRSKEIKKFFLSHIPFSARLFDYMAKIAVILYSSYLTFLFYTHYTQHLGKLLALFFVLYMVNDFLKLFFGNRNYLIFVTVTSVGIIIAGVKNVF